MASTDTLSSMSTVELGLWLEEQGIPKEFCEKFEGKFSFVSFSE